MIDQFLAGSQFNQFLGLSGTGSKRLFNEDVLAVLQSGLGQLVVSPNRSNYGDRIDFRRTKDFVRIGYRFEFRDIALRARARAAGLLSHTICDGGRIQTMQIADNIWTPITVTNHSNSNHIFLSNLSLSG